MTPDVPLVTRVRGCNCFAARQAARSLSRFYEQHLAPAGITITQFSILVFLYETSNLTMSELAEEMAMERTTLVRALKPLQREGFVASETHRRRLLLSLSAEGYAKLKEASPLWENAQAALEHSIGAERAALLRHDLLDLTHTIRSA